MKPVLVRDLALERWPSMDRYADALTAHLREAVVPDPWSMAGPRYLRRYWTYPRALRRWRGDLVHVLDHSYAHCLRAFPGLPSVVTVHDLYPLHLLAQHERSLRSRVRDRLLRWVLDWAAAADRVIVSTRWAGDEVERCLGIPHESIHVVPYGIAAAFRAPADPAATGRRRAGWADRLGRRPAAVLLHVGTCEARKNVEAAIGALARLRAGGVDAAFVQVGGTFREPHHRAIQRTGMEGHVIQEPRVAEPDLVTAYQAADVLLVPSTFEGFGLPAIEAMAAGLPVVASGAGGLREAVADAAIVTGRADAEAFADAAGALLADAARRQAQVARGRDRAAALTWERAAELTRSVYERLLAA
jgi:alpha-1,3-rhamnosyl/mannosyltransferase